MSHTNEMYAKIIFLCSRILLSSMVSECSRTPICFGFLSQAEYFSANMTRSCHKNEILYGFPAFNHLRCMALTTGLSWTYQSLHVGHLTLNEQSTSLFIAWNAHSLHDAFHKPILRNVLPRTKYRSFGLCAVQMLAIMHNSNIFRWKCVAINKV